MTAMTAEIENLVLEHLKALRNEVREFRVRMEDDLKDVKLRLASLERGQAKSHAQFAGLYGESARQQSSIERLAEPIERIERRLELS